MIYPRLSDRVESSPESQANHTRLQEKAILKCEAEPSVIDAGKLSPRTIRALQAEAEEDQQLANADSIMKDGNAAERFAQIVFKEEGLPDGAKLIALDNVIDGKIGNKNWGIDLVGIGDGVPYLIEVKKRSLTDGDGLGNDRVQRNRLEPETLDLQAQIKEERAKLGFAIGRFDSRVEQAMREYPNMPERWDDYDEELSTLQMAGLWARDRWLKLVKDASTAQKLRNAGVDPQYLDAHNLKDPWSPQWKTLLMNRKIAVVGYERDAPSRASWGDAVWRRGSEPILLNVAGWHT